MIKLRSFQKIRKHKKITKNIYTQVLQRNIHYILETFLKKYTPYILKRREY
jgi:hypothetical protein